MGGQTVANSLVYSSRLRQLNRVVVPMPTCEAYKHFYLYNSLQAKV